MAIYDSIKNAYEKVKDIATTEVSPKGLVGILAAGTILAGCASVPANYKTNLADIRADSVETANYKKRSFVVDGQEYVIKMFAEEVVLDNGYKIIAPVVMRHDRTQTREKDCGKLVEYNPIDKEKDMYAVTSIDGDGKKKEWLVIKEKDTEDIIPWTNRKVPKKEVPKRGFKVLEEDINPIDIPEVIYLPEKTIDSRKTTMPMGDSYVVNHDYDLYMNKHSKEKVNSLRVGFAPKSLNDIGRDNSRGILQTTGAFMRAVHAKIAPKQKPKVEAALKVEKPKGAPETELTKSTGNLIYNKEVKKK